MNSVQSLQIRKPCFCIATLSLASYLLFRLFFEYQINGAGFETSGMLQYDSFYHFSFAQELLRNESWIFFKNPFGSFDESPQLFNLLASLLVLLKPLWASHLFGFDILFGALFSFIGAYCFADVLFRCSRQAQVVNYGLALLVLFGGGVGFVVASVFGLNEMEGSLLTASWWGLTWTTNQISSWEIFYHALFWMGISALTKGIQWPILLIGLVLFFLHPFTLIIFVLTCFGLSLNAVFSNPQKRIQVLTPLILVLLGLLGVLVYDFVLPYFSRDAEFFRQVYQRLNFHLDALSLLCFFAPSLLCFLGFLFARERDANSLRRSPGVWVFASLSILLLSLDLSYLVGDFVPQPAHWLRVYPIAFMILAASAVKLSDDQFQRKKLCAAFILLLFLSFFDGVLGVKTMSKALVRDRLPPAILDKDSAGLISKLAVMPPQRLVYLRSCQNRSDFPALEYALSALTPHEIGFGHIYFSRDLDSNFKSRFICEADSRILEKAFNSGEIFIFDFNLAEFLQLKGTERFGRFVIYRK